MRRYWPLALGALAIGVLFAFPPYMAIDQSAPDTRHGAIGHHPRWQAPTADAAESVLSSEVGPPRAGALPALRVRINRVRLVLEVVTVTGAALCAFGALRWHRRRNARVTERQGGKRRGR
jgi:hypothetical protein